jgi:hypothetical protein
VDDAGRVTALSDSGVALMFRAGQAHSRLLYRQLPVADWQVGLPRWHWDTESMTRDPATGRIWVGYEVDGHICRYEGGLRWVENCVWPAASALWPGKTSMESLARLPDGRFLAIAEDSPGPDGRGHDVLLFAGDPALPDGPSPERLTYVAPQGYLPTDAVAIGSDKLLVLNRRLTLMNGFTAVLMLVDIHDLRPGAVLRGREVARLGPPLVHDNFEALAISREGGRPVLWIASDDNHLFMQRSLLLKFAVMVRGTSATKIHNFRALSVTLSQAGSCQSGTRCDRSFHPPAAKRCRPFWLPWALSSRLRAGRRPGWCARSRSFPPCGRSW